MKKVRNILILLLAALMLTVFVSCSEPEVNIPSGGDNEVVGPHFDRVPTENLIISKFYMGDDHEVPAEGAKNAPAKDIIQDCKFIVLTNISSEDIDLSEYAIGYRKPETKPDYTPIFKLPKATLAAGKSLYCLNFHGDSLRYLFDMFPNMETLPFVEENTTAITEDSVWVGAKGYYNGETTVELIKNYVLDRMDGNFEIYNSWDIVDEVLVDGKMPPRGTALVRNVDPATHKADDFTAIPWDDLEKIKAMDAPVKGSRVVDYTFATLKTEVIDKLTDTDPETKPTKALPTRYYAISNTHYNALKAEAKAQKYYLNLAGSFKNFQITVQNGSWVIKQDTYNNYGKWYFNDYNAQTIIDKIKAEMAKENPSYTNETLGEYPKYYEMDNYYKNKFKSICAEAGFIVNIESEQITFEIASDTALIQNKEGWTVKKAVKDTELEMPFAVTEIYLGNGNCKYFGLTNVSKEAVALNDYWYGFNCKINSEQDFTDHFFALPDVTVDSGCTVFVVNNGYGAKLDETMTVANGSNNSKIYNNLTNYSELTYLGSEEEPAEGVTSVTGKNAIYSGLMIIAGKNTVYIGKGEMNSANIIKTYDNVCLNQNPQTKHYYVRDIDKLEWKAFPVAKKADDAVTTAANASLITLKTITK